MSLITQYGNYVKFLRGTPNAYAQLNPKDNDTLYFISENNADHGVLYLGDKLISGSISGSTTLQDLTDVLLSANVDAGSLLYYDGEHWVNKTLAEIFEIIVGVMRGATEDADGRSGLVPTPKQGMQNLYLRGDATWANPVAAIEPIVNVLSTQVGTLIGNDMNKSMREVAQEEVAAIVDNAPAAFDTLKEIADYLAEHPTESDVAQRLIALETAVNTPSTGLLDRTALIEVAVGNLNDALEELKSNDILQNQQITNIQLALEALKWQELIIV